MAGISVARIKISLVATKEPFFIPSVFEDAAGVGEDVFFFKLESGGELAEYVFNLDVALGADVSVRKVIYFCEEGNGTVFGEEGDF